MATVRRYDLGALQNPEITSQGYLKVGGLASRTGIQLYRRPDGSTKRELRPREEVMAPQSLKAFEGLPLADDHPDGEVNVDNTQELGVGHVLAPGEPAGDYVGVKMLFTRPSMIAKLQKPEADGGKRQLSVGYAVDLDETPGVDPTYGPYDAIQRNIRPNHLAVVDFGRAGPMAKVNLDRLRLDAADAFLVEDMQDSSQALAPMQDLGHDGRVMITPAAAPNPTQPATPAAEPKKDAIVMDELQKQLVAAMTATATEKSRADKLDADLKAANDKTARLEGELESAKKDADAQKTRADKAIEDAKTDAAKIRKDAVDSVARLANERAEVLKAADAILGAVDKDGKKIDRSAMTDKQIKIDCVEKVDGVKIAADKHDEYVNARFEGASDRHAASAGSAAAVTAAVVDGRKDGPGSPLAPKAPINEEALAAAKLKKANSTAWMTTQESK
jgi:hypothetical protein